MVSEQYRKSMMPNNTRFSVWLSRVLDFLIWGIASLFICLAVAVCVADPLWALWLVVVGILVCPLVPIHFGAKLVLAAFGAFPREVAISLSLVFGLVWGWMDLGRSLPPAED